MRFTVLEDIDLSRIHKCGLHYVPPTQGKKQPKYIIRKLQIYQFNMQLCWLFTYFNKTAHADPFHVIQCFHQCKMLYYIKHSRWL